MIGIGLVEVQRYNSGLELYDSSSIAAGVRSVLFPLMLTSPVMDSVTNDHYEFDTSYDTTPELFPIVTPSTDDTASATVGHSTANVLELREVNTEASNNASETEDKQFKLKIDNNTFTTYQKPYTRPSPTKLTRFLIAMFAFLDEFGIRSFLTGTVVSAWVAAWIWREQQERISLLDRTLVTDHQKFNEKQNEDAIALENAKQDITNAVSNANSKLETADADLLHALASVNTLQVQLGDSQEGLLIAKNNVDDLRTRLNDSQKILETTNNDADSLQIQLEDSQDSLARANEESEKVKVELQDLRECHRTDIRTLNTKLLDSQKATKAAQGTIEEFELRFNTSQNAKDSANKKICELENALSSSQKATNTANEGIRGLEKRFADSQTVAESAHGDISKLKSDLSASQSAAKSATGKLKKMETDLAASQKALETSAGTIRELEEAVNKGQKNVMSANARIAELEIDLSDAQKAKGTSTGRVSVLEIDLQASNDSLDNANSHVETLEADLRTSHNSLEATKTRIDDLEHELQERISEATESSTKIQHLERKYSEATSATSSLQSQLQRSEDKTKEALAKADSFCDLLSKARASFSSQNEQVNKAQSDAKAAEKNAQKLRGDVASLRNELGNASTSLRSSKSDLQKCNNELSKSREALQEQRHATIELTEKLARDGTAHQKALNDEVTRHVEVQKELKEQLARHEESERKLRVNLEKAVRCTDCSKMRGLEKELEEWDVEPQASEGNVGKKIGPTKPPRRRTSSAPSSNTESLTSSPKIISVTSSHLRTSSTPPLQSEAPAPTAQLKSVVPTLASDATKLSSEPNISATSRGTESSPRAAHLQPLVVSQESKEAEIASTSPQPQTTVPILPSEAAESPLESKLATPPPQTKPLHSSPHSQFSAPTTLTKLSPGSSSKQLNATASPFVPSPKAISPAQQKEQPAIVSPVGKICIHQAFHITAADTSTGSSSLSPAAPKFPIGLKLKPSPHYPRRAPEPPLIAPPESAASKTPAFDHQVPHIPKSASHDTRTPSQNSPHHRAGPSSSANDSFQRQFANLMSSPVQASSGTQQGQKPPPKNAVTAEQADRGAVLRIQQMLGK